MRTYVRATCYSPFPREGVENARPRAYSVVRLLERDGNAVKTEPESGLGTEGDLCVYAVSVRTISIPAAVNCCTGTRADRLRTQTLLRYRHGG